MKILRLVVAGLLAPLVWVAGIGLFRATLLYLMAYSPTPQARMSFIQVVARSGFMSNFSEYLVSYLIFLFCVLPVALILNAKKIATIPMLCMFSCLTGLVGSFVAVWLVSGLVSHSVGPNFFAALPVAGIAAVVCVIAALVFGLIAGIPFKLAREG